ncbi:MAG TPA: hypothetical protein VNU64_08235 [Burkholderiales bacterium]|nr:hypothetical protein [Burkholderiales bacterium]
MRTIAFLISLAFAASAVAQLRTIPPDARRAQMSHVQENVVTLNGQTAQLAAGAQIRDAMNRIVLPTALPAGSIVKYQLDSAGRVYRAWILTPEEADQPDR